MGSVNASKNKPRLWYALPYVQQRPETRPPPDLKVKAESRILPFTRRGESQAKQRANPLPVKQLNQSYSRIQRIFRAMNIAQRGAAQRARARVNIGEGEPGIIDLTSDSETDDDIVELASQLVRPQVSQNQPQLLDTPSPEPQNRPVIPADANSRPGLAIMKPPSPGRSGSPEIEGAVMGDYVFDDKFEDEFDDEMIARAIEREFQDQDQQYDEISGFQRQENQSPMGIETRLQCLDNVVILFPGICRDHVSELYNTVSKSSDQLIAFILDKTEKGTPYPKARDQQKVLKRKRDVDEDEEAARKYGALDRVIPSTGGNSGMRGYIRNILSQEFSETPMAFIDATLSQSGYRLFSAYRVLEEAHRTFNPRRPPYNKIKKQRTVLDTYNEENIDAFIAAIDADQARVEVLRELLAARRIRRRADRKRLEARHAELKEEENIRKAETEGTMSECGCCYGDYPLNRMVHCDNDEMHWFCRGCALRNAETEIGNSKFELKCMSMDGCTSGFSREQRYHFLNDKTVTALERNEQEASLRLAGIENLASCPFCPYAAEYPPVEVNREFRCEAADCEKVSCRLCKLESHIPKSCEEHAKENGLSIRRQIEEAMSAAMIRKCNKCGTPFVKEEGCNKMTCTRNGCFNVQCYVCSKSCGYDHFDDRTRGGKAGNCPLFESVDQRHDQEVKEAEKIALEKARADHPEYTEEDLKVRMSENVLKDDERRKANDPRARLDALRAAQGAAGDGLRHYFDIFPHRPFIRRAPPPPPQLGVVPQVPVVGGQAYVGRPYGGGNYGEIDGAFADVDNDDDIFNNLWDDLPHPVADIAAMAPPHVVPRAQGAGANPWQFIDPLPELAHLHRQPAAPPAYAPYAPVIPELRNLSNILARQERVAALGLGELPAGPGPEAPEAGLAQHQGGLAEFERMIAQQRQLVEDIPPEMDRRQHHRNFEQRFTQAQVDQARLQRAVQLEALPAAAHPADPQPSPARKSMRAHPQAVNVACGAQVASQYMEQVARAVPAVRQPQAAPNAGLLRERIRLFEDDGMRRARQQHMLDHAERRLHRRQEVARLRREQEHDEAAVARGLRQLGEVAEAMVAEEHQIQKARLAGREDERNWD